MPSGMPELDERSRRIMEESDARHAETLSVSFEAYRRRRYDELNARVSALRSVYLDMKYWIWLRDPERSPFPAETKALRMALAHGARTGRADAYQPDRTSTSTSRTHGRVVRRRCD